MQCVKKIEIAWLAERLPTLTSEFAAYDRMRIEEPALQEARLGAERYARINLRDADRERRPDQLEGDILPSRATPHAALFPKTMSVLGELSTALCGDLGRARYILLSPYGMLGPRKDSGRYYCRHDSYHLILSGDEGTIFDCGGCANRMRQGELWWVNQRVSHEIRNSSGRWKIHLKFELLPPQTLWL
jgi:hypothetical protein